jgi:hypothetical protein
MPTENSAENLIHNLLIYLPVHTIYKNTYTQNSSGYFTEALAGDLPSKKNELTHSLKRKSEYATVG